ncbi:hypothetical protein HK104_007838 [Borealophlyctis nickersoniae]|nr:hypothetical protein HK104_007838 [Borealophlyctis nickersoniae]
MDGSDDCLPEDEELISLPSLRPYYRSLDRESVKNCLCGKHLPPAEQMSARVSRIARFGKRLSDDERFDFFRFNEQEAQFVVLDDEAKKKGMQKLMRVLAAERLKDQVSALEQSVSVLKEASRPIAVLDAYCYVHNLRLVKGWLTSRSCIIVVSSEAIDALDRMKKGDESINVRAREAIRYLEQRFRYRSDCLIAQKTEERVIGWSSDGYVGENHDVFVPKPYRPVLACSLHYQTHVAPSAIDGTDVPFALVTDDAELRGVAQAAGVVVRSVGEWAKLLEGRGRKRRR